MALVLVPVLVPVLALVLALALVLVPVLALPAPVLDPGSHLLAVFADINELLVLGQFSGLA